MVTTMRKARLWTLGLCVLTVAATAAFGARAGGRVLTTQDVISVKVVNQPDMDTATRVETDGTIDFPYIGRIRAAGLSEDELAHAIERRLAARQIVTDPHVLVEISSFGAQISVQGQVGASGVYALDRPTNLTQVLSRAGGLRDSGLGGTITVRRGHGRIVKTFDAKEVQAGRGPGATLQVVDGDEIFVELAPFYYLYGYVGHPGEFQLTRPLTVQEALSIGGGVAANGSEWRIRIKRKSADGQAIEVPASLDDQVEAGDIIVVNERIF
jgi:polysaccharide biosynthesis/export protein